MEHESLEQLDEAELALFKKKLKKMKEFKGRGTELISVYMPEDVDRSSITGQINAEMSQSSNIKSPQTRKNVQGALRRIDNFLKQIDFKLPKNGLVVFSGNISQQEGKSDIQLMTLRPIRPLKTKLYWCDSEFHLAPLEDMVSPKDIFGIIVIDKSDSTIAALVGKKYEILGRFTSGISGKHRAGGQSSTRFERLHEEAAQEFYKRISEKINEIFLPYGDKLKGLIVAGPGMTKNYFLNKELIDQRIRKKILGLIDTSYTDESGIREVVQKADELLKDADIIKEKNLINKFLEAIVKSGLAAYGQKEVEEALSIGKVSTLLVSDAIEWMVFKFHCEKCGFGEEFVAKEPSKFDSSSYKCGKCGSTTQIEILEEIDYADWAMEKAHSTGATIYIVSTDTPEGEQFFKGFGGIGALLRYR
jgi:peptide chain release factor subunit 1